MKMLMIVRIPPETFNDAVRDGTAGETIGAILEDTKPESVYFTEMEGSRTAVMIVDLEKESMVPKFAEPWFLSFDAEVEFHVAMSPGDLQEAGLDALGKKWGG
jgi:hypothetical protein